MTENDDRVERLASALQGLLEQCQAHLPHDVEGKYWTKLDGGGYFIERELRIARETLSDIRAEKS